MPADRAIAPHLLEDLPRPVAEVLEDFVAMLRELGGLFQALKRSPIKLPGSAITEATMLAAVFGVYVLPAGDRETWRKLFPHPLAQNASGSSTGSGCGSSGCGGGGSCGGGGCGGCGS